MNFRILMAAVVLCGSTVLAKPISRPAREPNKPVAEAPASRPATQPAAARTDYAKEVFNKYQEQKKREADQLKVAYIDLDREVSERPPVLALLGDTSLTLQTILGRLEKARLDKDIRGVLLNFGETEFNLAQAQEIRDAIAAVRKEGKRVFVYSDTFSTASYVAATGSRDICMLAGGEIMIPGVGIETWFAKGLLDKIGVKADYVQIGQYKGADEQFTRTEPSVQMRGELNKILDSLYGQIVDGIAYQRNLPRTEVETMINGVMMNGKTAKQRGFVDHLVDQDGLRDLIKQEMGREIGLIHDYGAPAKEDLDLSNPFAMLSSLTKKPDEPATKKPTIAVVYAEGVIVDGSTQDKLFGAEGIGSEDLRKAMRLAARDQSVKAIVLRIDSPGGSAMASEVAWQSIRRAARNKPLVVSIGGMAASGGYYLASASDWIVADPSAIVGSIGVVGGKFVIQGLFEKVGMHSETFTRGKNANLFGMSQGFSEQQRRLVTNWMQQTYDQFVERIMTTRKGRIKDIDEVAHGRVFLAKQAKELGMVDELGGIERAVAVAAEKAKLQKGQYEMRLVPGTRTLLDLLRGNDPDAAMPFVPQISAEEMLMSKLLPQSSVRMLRQQLQMIQLLQQRPVILVAPYTVTIR